MNYTNYYKKINAIEYSIPQNRSRVFMISFLGIHDKYKNGTEIYEGDVLLSIEKYYPSYNPYFNYSEEQLKEFCKYDEKEDEYYEECEMYMKVEYNNEKAMFELINIHAEDSYNFYNDFEPYECEVIGNIFENPTLFEEGNK